MTIIAKLLIGVLVYLVIGIILKNHTKIGTIQFRNFSTRFIFFWLIPLGGLVFYLLTNTVYVVIMCISEAIFDDLVALDENLFPGPNRPKYPRA